MNQSKSFSVPEGWQWVSFGSCANLINGRAYKQSELLSSGTPVLRIQNLNRGDRWYYSDLSLPENKYCQKGDLLYAWSATFGPYLWTGPRCIYHYHIWKIEPKPHLDKLFGYYLLQWISKAVKQAAHGITMVHMTKEGMESWLIPLPPLEEQCRIAAILDKADAVRRKRQSAIALTEELLRSAFLEMFGDPVTNPKGWEMVELGEMLSIVSGQVNPQDTPYIDMPHIGGENIQANTGRINGVQTPREIGLQSGKYLFEPTDVLYSKIRPYLNKVVIPGFIGVCSADIYPLRVDGSKLSAQYLVYLLRSNTFLEYAEKHSARTNIPKINRPALLKFTSPYPPLNLQKKFSAIYDKVHSTTNQINHAVEDGNNLFNSLLQKAFRGEL